MPRLDRNCSELCQYVAMLKVKLLPVINIENRGVRCQVIGTFVC